MNLRKILSTGLLMFAGMAAIQAQQRKCDMSVSLVSPAEGAIINAFAQYNVTVSLTNNGPDNLLQGDTIYYNISPMFALSLKPFYLPQAIAPGASATMTLESPINNNQNDIDVTAPYCLKVVSNAEHKGLFIDTAVTSNNTDCNSVTLRPTGSGTAVKDIAAVTEILNFYPNPAQDNIRIKFESAKAAPVHLIVRDITGRILQQQDFGKVTGLSTLPLNITGLSKGLYVVELRAGDRKIVGKLVKK